MNKTSTFSIETYHNKETNENSYKIIIEDHIKKKKYSHELTKYEAMVISKDIKLLRILAGDLLAEGYEGRREDIPYEIGSFRRLLLDGEEFRIFDNL